MQDSLGQGSLKSLAVLYGSPIGKLYAIHKLPYQASKLMELHRFS